MATAIAPLQFPRPTGLRISERVDLDVLRAQIACPAKVLELDKSDFKHRVGFLSRYVNSVDDTGALSVDFSTHSHGYGRYYATQSISLQYQLKSLRHAQMKGLFLNDLNNCNYRFLQGLCERHKIPCKLIQEYVNDRKAILAQVIKHESTIGDMGSAKVLLLSMLNFSKYHPEWAWLKAFRKEVRDAVKAVIRIYPWCAQIKQGNVRESNKPPEATAIYFLLATCERWAVDVAYRVWREHDVDITAYIYDALGTTEQLTQDLLDEAARQFFNESGLAVVWSSEPVPLCPIWDNIGREQVERRDIWDKAFQSFSQVKKRFEKNHFKVRKPLAYVQMGELADGSTDRFLRSEKDLMGVYRNFYYYDVDVYARKEDKEQPIAQKNKRKATGDDVNAAPDVSEKWVVVVDGPQPQPFIRLSHGEHKWLDDETLRTYEALTFAPPPALCGKDDYNTWDGFLVERLSAPTDEDLQLFHTWILPFIEEIVCDNFGPAYKYLITWLAQLFQQPGWKSRVAIVLLGEEGVGKTKLTEMICDILGMALCFRTTDLENDCFGRFSNVAENRLMACFDELDPKEVNGFYNKLMDLITGLTMRCENKGIGRPFNVSNFLRVIITTNEEHNLMRIRSKDRKYQYISVSSARMNDATYFGELTRIMKRPGVQRAFYDHLMAVDIKGFDFINDRAPCQAYNLSKDMNTRRELLFLTHHVKAHPQEIGARLFTTNLFKDFMDWIRENTSGKCLEYSTNTQALGVYLAKVPGFTRSASHGKCAAWDVNADELLSHLLSLDLLSEIEKECITEIRCDQLRLDAELAAGSTRAKRVKVLWEVMQDKAKAKESTMII
jgi:Family of unknown function (DUF5906)